MSATLSVIPSSWEVLIQDRSWIERLDLAEMNLLTAMGLPGTENLNIERLSAKVDEWLLPCKLNTIHSRGRWEWMKEQEKTMGSVGNSMARFLMYCMVEALQRDCGVKYNPARKLKPDFCKPEDVFIHGLLQEGGEGGTCASMPVVYVAVGRRLGYPMFLKHTKGHLYCCWNSETETIVSWDSPAYYVKVPPETENFDGAGEGFSFPSDSHYLNWPHRLKREDLEFDLTYFRPLTQVENLAAFLCERAHYLSDLHRHREAVITIYHARLLCPDSKRYEGLHKQFSLREIDADMARIEMMQEMDDHWRQGQRGNQPAMPWDRAQEQNRQIFQRQALEQERMRRIDAARIDPITKLNSPKE